MDHFYVDLPSNASLDMFPNNTLANFKVKLPHPIRSTIPYKVALVEMIYPHKHLNIAEKEAYLECYEKPYDTSTNRERLYIPSGIYERPVDITSVLNPMVRFHGFRFDFIDEINRFRSIGGQKNKIRKFVNFSGNLAKMLGYGDGTDEHVLVELNEDAKYSPDFRTDRSPLFVYTNIIEHQVVGDSLSKVLRIVNFERAQDSGLTCEKYLRPYYLPVDRQVLDVIEINIKDIAGSAFPFVSGSPVILKLHFRPKNGTSSLYT